MHLRLTLLLAAVAAAESITFMFPFYASIWSAGIQTITDSTTVYNAQCDNQGEFGPCQEGQIYTYTILDDRRFAYTVSNAQSTLDIGTNDGSRTTRTVAFYNSVNASCSITSSGAQCVSTRIAGASTEGGLPDVTTTSTAGYRSFVEFVIDVPATGTVGGHVTAVTSPVLGANTPDMTSGPQSTVDSAGSSSSMGTSGANSATTKSSAIRAFDSGVFTRVLALGISVIYFL